MHILDPHFTMLGIYVTKRSKIHVTSDIEKQDKLTENKHIRIKSIIHLHCLIHTFDMLKLKNAQTLYCIVSGQA